ncbi:Cyanovirin-N [Sordaria brevicollis]|uniref:Cyanovirin-N n=1 Tax=Sordaria brevicollis TaxID=83679 RepID=A0AAE0P320_SORBR|nr:Cyanovirin-N [Sordaria brevicollis]
MAFYNSCRGVELNGSTLAAQCQCNDGSWRYSAIDLDEYIGNNDGKFDTRTNQFFATASNAHLEGSVLHAKLKNSYGGYNDEQTVDLNLFITNDDGYLKFKQYMHESILKTGTLYYLEGSVLKGLVLGYNGKFNYTEIDLNEHYANKNGCFQSDDNHFYHSSQNLRLDPSPGALTLKAELMNWNKEWQKAEVNLAVCIMNNNGGFQFVRHDGFWDRDGWFANTFESVPLIGFVIAGVHAAAGNSEHAARALAKCANSSVVCVGVVVGFMFGETLGSVIGAGIATPIGIWIETEIKEHLIEDPMLLAQFEEATLGRYIGETLLNMGMAAIPGDPIANMASRAGNEALKKTFQKALTNYTRQVVAGMRSSVATTEVEAKVKILLSGIGDLLKGETPASWSEAEEKVANVLRQRGAELLNVPPMVKFNI